MTRRRPVVVKWRPVVAKRRPVARLQVFERVDPLHHSYCWTDLEKRIDAAAEAPLRFSLSTDSVGSVLKKKKTLVSVLSKHL